VKRLRLLAYFQARFFKKIVNPFRW
jgi:hypothetical protein